MEHLRSVLPVVPSLAVKKFKISRLTQGAVSVC